VYKGIRLEDGKTAGDFGFGIYMIFLKILLINIEKKDEEIRKKMKK
jgi:hypothetical protein